MSAPIFPDEPIKAGPSAVEVTAGIEYEPYDDEGDPDARRCQTCGGEGFKECDDDCDQADDCGCPFGRAHLATCPNCRGSGDAKDQWYW
jgi:hypothetical protein